MVFNWKNQAGNSEKHRLYVKIF